MVQPSQTLPVQVLAPAISSTAPNRHNASSSGVLRADAPIGNPNSEVSIGTGGDPSVLNNIEDMTSSSMMVFLTSVDGVRPKDADMLIYLDQFKKLGVESPIQLKGMLEAESVE